jgi:peptidoglycan/LPS O-acetylase OafA/YrhL
MPSTTNTSPRLVELDSLRGLAAFGVLLFHYTTRYDQAFGHSTEIPFHAPWGMYGVNLFFVISGFVIFMTLERTRQASDFLVSRFSRLFPAFWVAIAITFCVTHLWTLPGKTVSIDEAAWNMTMLHGMFKVPDVDGVYWTLEIELIFYALALLVFLFGLTRRIHAVLMILIALRLVWHLTDVLADVKLSWTISHLLILPYIGWFSCGIMIYRRTATTETPRLDWLVLALAVLQLLITDGPWMAALCVAITFVMLAAIQGKAILLRTPLLVGLGTISYTLYLLHENIGWDVIYHLEKRGWAPEAAIAAAMVTSITLASALTLLVEKPAMTWIRAGYKRYRPQT